jgi:hypothetical protein
MATTVDIRCYCHGLGDCMLLKLPRKGGGDFWMLIDCGIHSAASGGSQIMRNVAADIAATTGGRLDVVVGTHEHWDHLSAFLQAAEAFEGITVGEVWFSWAENPADEQARNLDRFKGDAAAALAASSIRLSHAAGMDDLAQGVNSLLGFVFGVDGERVRGAREKLRSLGSAVRHFEPGTLAPLPQVAGVRAYVLGPPRDPRLLGIEDILSETYAFGGSPVTVAPLANGLGVNDGALRVHDDPAAPFDGAVGAHLDWLLAGRWDADERNAVFFWDHYLGAADEQSQDWRRIDNDWLSGSVELALQLDSRTNNSSLVLAFEIEETGRILLFAADAQIGNWMSWPSVTFPAEPGKPPVTGDDLVRRTVFYKVGHHGSRNATRTAALEQMDRSMLVAFSPTDESLAGRVGWKDFPAPKTTARLLELTSGRFIQSDAAWIRDSSLACPVPETGALRKIRIEHGRYVDLTIG